MYTFRSNKYEFWEKIQIRKHIHIQYLYNVKVRLPDSTNINIINVFLTKWILINKWLYWYFTHPVSQLKNTIFLSWIQNSKFTFVYVLCLVHCPLNPYNRFKDDYMRVYAINLNCNLLNWIIYVCRKQLNETYRHIIKFSAIDINRLPL